MSHKKGTGSEAARIAEVEAILHKLAKSSEDFKKSGLDVVSLLGLTEEAAAGLAIALEKVDGKFEGMIEGKVQTRNIQGIQPGGPGFGKQARSLYLKSAAKITHGEMPEIKSALEQIAYADGMFAAAAKNLVTAAVSFKQVPEVLEDQILIALSAAKEMGMSKVRSIMVKERDESLVEGMSLQQGQTMGVDAQGRNVAMDLKGSGAVITEFKEVFSNGVKMVKISFDEFNEAISGAKVSTRPGHKGIMKVVPDDYITDQLGAPKGTQAVASLEGFMKRGDLQDLIAMISTSMSDGGKHAAQYIFDKITAAMKNGSEMLEAVQSTASELGLDPNAAFKATSGALAGAGVGKALTGRLSWFRMEKEGQTGEAKTDERFLDPIAIQALGMRTETLSQAMAAQERSHNLVIEKQKDYFNALLHLTGASDQVTKGLQQMNPEDFAILPAGMHDPELTAGTLSDKAKMADPFAMRMPARGGGFEDMFVPGMGQAAGQRGGFIAETGLFSPDDITKQFEKLRRQAVQIKASRGDLDPGTSRETAGEIAEFVNRQMQNQIQAITRSMKGGAETKSETKELIATFKQTFMPLINKMTQMGLMAENTRFTTKSGRIKDHSKMTPDEYVAASKGPVQQINKMRDLLGIRSSQGQSIGGAGALFDVNNIELLKEAMDRMGKSAGEDAQHMDKLWSRFEKLKEQLLGMYTAMGYGKESGRPSREEMRKVAQTRGSGISPAPYTKAVEFAVDVSTELKFVEDSLKSMAAAGKDVKGTLSALERIKSLQVSDDALPQDAVLLSKEDYANMVRMTQRLAKEKGKTLSQEEAKGQLSRGIMHRYPTTGGASFQIVKLLEDTMGRLPEGQIGIPGAFATSSTEDIQKVRAPLEELRASLMKTVRANDGQGDAAEAARARISELNKVLAGLTHSFDKAMMNLDFDGDSTTVHAALTKDAANEMMTVKEIMSAGGTSLQGAMRTLLGSLEGGKDWDFESLEGIQEAFRATVKRPDELKRALPMPVDENTARLEASALVGGKLSVGLLSDAFNILHSAIVSGAGKTDDAFATAMDHTMLNINKSLAAKHGTGDLSGPTEFVEDLRRGQTSKIFAGMDAGGGGLYGDMGKLNDKYRKQIEQQLVAQSPGKLLEEAIKRGILAEGAEIDSSNFNSVIDQLVDSMDLKSQIMLMWEKLRSNMKDALMKGGATATTAEHSIKQMLKPDEKGKIPGINLDDLVPESYRFTRKRHAEGLRAKDPMEQAADILRATMGEMAGKITKLEVEPDGIKAAGQTLSSKVEAWLNALQEMYGVIEDDLLRAEGLDPKRVTGLFDDRMGGPGAIMVSESTRQRPAEAAVEALKRLESGELQATPKLIGFITKALANLGQTVAHERIHQGSRQFRDSVDNISDALLGAEGPMGRARNQIMQLANQLQNVKIEHSKFEKLRSMDPSAAVTGMPEYAGMTAGQAAPKQGRKYFNLVAEEMMAHLASPERWQEIFGPLPAAVGSAIHKELNRMRQALPDMIDPIQDSIAGINTGIVEAYIEAIRNQGSSSASQVRGEAESRIGDIQWPGYQDFVQKTEALNLSQRALKEGRTERGLAHGETKGGKLVTAGALKFDFEGQFGDSVAAMRDVLKQMSQDLDPESLARLRDTFHNEAKIYREAIKSSGEQGAGRKGFQEYTRAVQEFQAHELQMYINRARKLQNAIAALRNAGQQDTTEFADVVEEFDNAMVQINAVLSRLRLPGAGAMSGIAATRGGGMTDAAGTLGIKPGEEQYKAVIERQTRQSEDFKPMGQSLDRIKDEIKAGMDSTQAWAEIWDELVQDPRIMADNMARIAEIMAEFKKLAKFEVGGEAEKSFEAIAKNARDAAKELERLGVRSGSDLAEAMGSSKVLQKAGTRGKGLAEAVEEQMENAKKRALQWQQEMNDILAAGFDIPGKHLQGGTIDIIDPKSQQVLKKFRLEGTKTGKTVTAALNDITTANQRMTGTMRSALRRVVQWGFATGVVYGTIRAFRQAADTITTVEDKITGLKKVMDTSVTNFARMQDGAVGFAKEFGVAIEDVLDGMVVYGQQGLKMGKIMERTRATMLAVNVTTMSSVNATEALTAAHKVFGDQVSTSTEFVDAWAAVAARHAITAEDLADAVKRSGAAAQVAGVGFEDFMGIVTAIGAVTRQTGKEIATSTKFMFRAMRRPTAQKALGEMGIQSMTPGGDFRSSLDILKQVAAGWDGMTRAQQVNLAQAMAGIRHYNSFIVLMNNFDEALLASADAANSQGFAMRKNRLAMQTFSKNMSVLRESVKGLAIELGKTLLPVGTGLIQLMTGMTKAVSSLPSGILTATTAIAGMGLAIHKTSDLLADSMDAFSTGEVDLPDGGRGGIMRKIGASASGISSGWSAASALDMGADAAELTRMGKAAFYAKKGLIGLGQKGGVALMQLGSVIPVVGAAVTKLGTALALGGAAAGGVVLAGIVATLGGLYYAYRQVTKSAADFEQEQEKAIGQSEDTASRLRAQISTADRLALSYVKVTKAAEGMSDNAKLQSALREGRFKSAAKAAQTYSDMLSEVSNSMAALDPSSVRGITETGDYVTGVDKNFQALTASALDARNAITMAMKTDVISEFAKELETPEGIIDNIAQGFLDFGDAITGGAFNLGESGGYDAASPLGKLADVRKEIQKVAEEMRKQESTGEYTLVNQDKMNRLVREEQELRQQTLGTAENMRRILESMPTFEDMGMAGERITPELFQNLSGAAAAGGFGRGSTGESVITQFMARQAGQGGIIDYKAAQSASLTAAAFHERGILGEGGAGAVTSGVSRNEIAILSKEAGEALAVGTRTMWADFDRVTGQVMYRYWDSTTQSMETLSGNAVQATIAGLESQSGNVATHFMRYAQKEVEAAADNTKKVLSMQFTGALAGVRVPAGGMPNLGPARNEELTVDQRVLKSMPVEMQKLANVQAEFNALTKEYSEEILSDVQGAYTRQAKSGQALKVMTQEILVLASKLQQEGFLLTVMGNYQKMQEQLAITLEQSAEAARDAARAEENRSKYLKTTSGALAGMGELPNLDLGKGLKELTSQERLARDVPGVAQFMRNVASTERQRGADVELLNEIEKQMAAFQDASEDMKEAGESMTAQQKERMVDAAMKGATPGELEMIRSLETETGEVQSILEGQTSLQEQMLEKLGVIAELSATADPNERAKIMAGHSYQEQTKAFSQVAGGAQLRDVLREVLKIRPTGKDGAFEAVGDGNPHQRIAEMMNAYAKLSKIEHGGGTGTASVGEGGFMGFGGDKKGYTRAADVHRDLQAALEETFSESAGLLEQMSAEMISRTSSGDFEAAARAAEIEQKNTNIAEYNATIAKKQQELEKKYGEAKKATIASLEQANRELAAKESFRIAVATETFAKSLEDISLDMEKAALLGESTKIKSAIDGVHAIVGQPGGRTDFENRRRELEQQGRNRPMSLSDMRARDQALADLDQEEKAAKIKEKQDVEIAALRQIQSQANQVREVLAGAALDPNLDEGTRKKAQDFLTTLNEELATSEQAQKKGRDGELFFKGIPSLDRLADFAKEMRTKAEGQAKKAAQDQQAAAVRQGTTHVAQAIQNTGDQQLAELRAIRQAFEALAKQRSGLTENPTASTAEQQALSNDLEARGWPRTRTEAQAAAAGAPSLQEARQNRANQAGMGGAGLLAAMGLRAKGAVDLPTDVIETKFGRVINTVQKIGDDLVVASSHLDGKLVGLQEFKVETASDGSKVLKGTHIKDAGVELPEHLRGQGIGSGRLAETMKWAQAEGFSEIRSTNSPLAEQTGAYRSAARRAGMDLSVSPRASDLGGGYMMDDLQDSALRVSLQDGPGPSAAEDVAKARAGNWRGMNDIEASQWEAMHNEPFRIQSAAQTAPQGPATAPGMGERFQNWRAGQAGAWTGSGWARAGKALGAAGVGFEAYQAANTMVGAESAQTPEELNKYGGQLTSQALGAGGVAALAAGGGAVAGPVGAIGGGLVGAAGMVADHFSGAGSLDYAGQWWNKKLGGVPGQIAQMGGKALMAPGNLAGDAADWWNTRGVDMGPGPTPAGEAPPAAAKPVAKDWDAIVAAKMAEAGPDVYSKQQLGGTMGNKFFASASSKRGYGGGTLISEGDLAGDGPINLNAYIDKMQRSREYHAGQTNIPAVGTTNSNLEMQRQARGQGNADNVPGGIVTNNNGAPGTQDTSAANRVNQQGGTGSDSSGTADAVESLSSAIESLNSKLDGLSELTLPDSLTSSIENIGSQVADAITGQSLSVEVTNEPSVTVSNLSDINTEGGDSALGADVLQLATAVSNLEGTSEIHTTQLTDHEGRITTNTALSTANQSALEALTTEVEGFDTGRIDTLATTQTAQEQRLAAVELESSTTAATVATTTADLATSRGEVTTLSETLEGIDARVTTAESNASDANILATEAKEEATEAKTTAENATTVAETATNNVSTLTDRLTALDQTIESNRQKVITEVGAVQTSVNQLTPRVTANERSIAEIRQLALTADQKAGQALGLAQKSS
jgi:TP901 family phage tail tape measure protein